jgi:multidrug resistance protein, MATE family
MNQIMLSNKYYKAYYWFQGKNHCHPSLITGSIYMNHTGKTSHFNFKDVRIEIKDTILLGFPIVIAQILHVSMGFVDITMTGNLSAEDLSAVSVSTSVTMPLLIFGIMLLSSTQALVAHSYGANLPKPKTGIITAQAIVIAQIIGWLLYGLSKYFYLLLPLFQIEPEVIQLAKSYISAYGLSLPAVLTIITINSFYLGIGITRLGVIFSVLGLLINIIGNYTLIFGNFGAPQLGAFGAGITSALASWGSLVGFVIFTLVNKEYRDYRLLRQIRFIKTKVIKEILKIGVPNGLSGVFEISMFAVFSLLMGNFGTSTLAGSQIALNFASFTFMIPLGLSYAVTTRVGVNLGKKEFQIARFAGYCGILLCLLVMIISAGIMFVFPEIIAAIYSNDPEVISMAASLLFFAGVFQISDGLQAATLGALRGYKDTKWPMIINLISYWCVGMNIGYILGFKYDYGAKGLWLGLIFGLSSAAVMHLWRFRKISRRYIGTIDQV